MPRIAPRALESIDAAARAAIEQAQAEGRLHTPMVLQITAHSPRAFAQSLAMLPRFPFLGYDEVFGADFCELLRLRSAQLGGCDSCQQARYTDSSEDLVCAITAPAGLGRREQLALRLMTLMHTDHHAIDRAFFVQLAEVFSAGEIVELGNMIAGMVGQHRWMHALALYSPEPPVCGEEEAVGVSGV